MSAAARSLTLQRADRARLRGGAADLGQILDTAALDRFVAYVQLLDQWRDAANLISCRDGAELVERHLLDSLACAWPCGAARDVADLGSGAGLPGIPLAIVDPARRVVLVEPRRRRASFLRQVRRELQLDHVEVRQMRVEDLDPTSGISPVDVAIARAVWSDDVGATVAAPWLRPGGVLLSMRAEGHSHSPAGLELRVEQSFTYRAGRGPQRRIDVFRSGLSGEMFHVKHSPAE